MTNIEEQFFKTFGIEPKYKIDIGRWDCETNSRKKLIVDVSKKEYLKNFKDNKLTPLIELIYPQITDRVLLELICILGTVIKQFKIPPKLNIEQLKYHILRNCINESEGIFTRVQSLFREEGE